MTEEKFQPTDPEDYKEVFIEEAERHALNPTDVFVNSKFPQYWVVGTVEPRTESFGKTERFRVPINGTLDNYREKVRKNMELYAGLTTGVY